MDRRNSEHVLDKVGQKVLTNVGRFANESFRKRLLSVHKRVEVSLQTL